jgi:hypothetical protein
MLIVLFIQSMVRAMGKKLRPVYKGKDEDDAEEAEFEAELAAARNIQEERQLKEQFEVDTVRVDFVCMHS